jgi:hypothetical protein
VLACILSTLNRLAAKGFFDSCFTARPVRQAYSEAAPSAKVALQQKSTAFIGKKIAVTNPQFAGKPRTLEANRHCAE